MKAAAWVRLIGCLALIVASLGGCWIFGDDEEAQLALWVVDGPELSAGDTYEMAVTDVGDTVQVAFNIKNDGGAVLHVSSVQIQGAGFTVVTGAGGFEVGDNGGQAGFEIQFAPTTAGEVTAQLTIRSDLPGSEVYEVFLAATASEPEPPPQPEPLAPPAWTHGTWRDVGDFNIYTFSADNVVANLMGTIIDFHQYNVDNLAFGVFYRDTEVTGTVYKIELWSAGSVAQTLTFTQVDVDTLSYQVDLVAPISLEKDP